MDRVKLIQQRLLTAQSKQKSYLNRHVQDVSFSIGEWVFLKVLLGKGVISGILFGLDQNLSIEEELIVILDRETRQLRTKHINSVKVQWRHRPVEEVMWKVIFYLRDRDVSSRGLRDRDVSSRGLRDRDVSSRGLRDRDVSSRGLRDRGS
ncbi:hypothetical protein MTR67_012725 [Solanum verrucosum]|uniref:Uncharacterized protein n=1 Tax=Solanum verrucosum TaxID=315347 RepID=A0AAF0QBU4_SOLVR|nr:hypothetical protein MTR67_012725 [Solanum verrucosum]